jgi:hypothetical protein
MIEKFVKSGLALPFRVLMVDEAQDLTPLQWDMVIKLALSSEKVYLAGDDDQAIYEWNGAEVTYFQTFPGKIKILEKSRRLNKQVHFFARCLLNGMEGYRVEKEFNSNGSEGTISKWNNFKKIPLDDEGSWMILARINDVKKELQDEARDMGIYFQDMRGTRSFDPNQWKAIQDWEKICEGGSITREDAGNMYNFLLNIDHGYRSTDSKKWSFAHPNQVFNFEQLHLQGGMVEEKKPWTEAFQRKFKEKEKLYFMKLVENGF